MAEHANGGAGKQTMARNSTDSQHRQDRRAVP
jgi:hypothetical protein